MKKLTVLLFLFAVNQSLGQDSLRVMYYNLLKYPSSGQDRYEEYKVFLEYAQPDVFLVNELESQTGADLILDSALNVNGTTHFERANFIDGYDTDNCLYYNSDKLGLVSQLQLGTVLRDISVYRMYYKAPNLTAQTDTIYMWFFCCHLKAGAIDFDQRNQEAQQAKFYLNDIAGEAENVFIGGDFNFYSGFESGCQTILNTGAVPMFDPVNSIGNWSGNPTFADWHTQSTRLNNFGGGSSGGMDDRFDIIFVSEDILNNDNGVSYINGTYEALGQDGAHYNQSINVGSNSAAPDSVVDALYYGSDHLPVMMDVVFDETASKEVVEYDYIQAYFNKAAHSLEFRTSLNEFELVLYDLMGKDVFRTHTSSKSISLPEGMKGIYIWSVNSVKGQLSDKIAIF